jgi:multidrug efflux pump subunit AcrA (membrane-fusion protein)
MLILNKKNKFLLVIIAFLLLAGAAFLIFKKPPADTQSGPTATEAVIVSAQTVKESRLLKQTLDFPAIVSAEEEADVYSKSGGTVKNADFKIGDQVSIGQILVKIDDVGAGSNAANGFNAAPVQQAVLGVEQARASYQQALKSYQDMLLSSERDLDQLGIAKDQASRGQENLNVTAGEAFKTAELAYQTAQTAAEQARLGLENRRAIAGQAVVDIRTNANTAADSAINTAGDVIVAINNITDLDKVIRLSLPYKTNLGALDINSLSQAQASYDAVRALNEEYRVSIFTTINAKVDAAIKLTEMTKKLADDVKYLFDKSVTSLGLPQTPGITGGPSLTGLQAAAAGYQAQLSATLAQVNGVKQGLNNIDLNNDATLTALEKAYEIAKTQEAAALQAWENLKATNKAQTDNSAFGVAAASNQYESAKIKTDTQLAVARTQLEVSRLAYQNAQLALQNAYDSRLAVAPISGLVTKKSVSTGDTVGAGQLLAVVSVPASVKLSFYIDRDNVGLLQVGQTVKIAYNGTEPIAGHLTSVALSADSATKRFLAEAKPDKADETNLPLGTVMNIILEITKEAQSADTVILPISAVDIGQNSNTVFTIVDSKAKKATIEIKRVDGEAVEVKTGLPADALIIVGNNKLLNEGDAVKWN